VNVDMKSESVTSYSQQTTKENDQHEDLLRQYEQTIRNHIEQENYFEIYIEKNKDEIDKLNNELKELKSKSDMELKELQKVNSIIEHDLFICKKESETQFFELSARIDSLNKSNK
jgi:ATP phosphoribosyltransferase